MAGPADPVERPQKNPMRRSQGCEGREGYSGENKSYSDLVIQVHGFRGPHGLMTNSSFSSTTANDFVETLG